MNTVVCDKTSSTLESPRYPSGSSAESKAASSSSIKVAEMWEKRTGWVESTAQEFQAWCAGSWTGGASSKIRAVKIFKGGVICLSFLLGLPLLLFCIAVIQRRQQNNKVYAHLHKNYLESIKSHIVKVSKGTPSMPVWDLLVSQEKPSQEKHDETLSSSLKEIDRVILEIVIQTNQCAEDEKLSNDDANCLLASKICHEVSFLSEGEQLEYAEVLILKALHLRYLYSFSDRRPSKLKGFFLMHFGGFMRKQASKFEVTDDKEITQVLRDFKEWVDGEKQRFCEEGYRLYSLCGFKEDLLAESLVVDRLPQRVDDLVEGYTRPSWLDLVRFLKQTQTMERLSKEADTVEDKDRCQQLVNLACACINAGKSCSVNMKGWEKLLDKVTVRLEDLIRKEQEESTATATWHYVMGGVSRFLLSFSSLRAAAKN